METKYIVRTNSWGNMSLYRGAKNLSQGWNPTHFADIAVRILRERGHLFVRVDGQSISYDLREHEGWLAIFTATQQPDFILFAQ